ncbi:MAG: hypothetical protein HKN04_05825 [Rhodothermaceae bacterium]|nr:hypothetical protein [Rhodothermaceae bacterium]
MPARLRPRFEFVTPFAPEVALRRLRDALAAPTTMCRGDVFRGHAVLHIPDAEQHVWSPFLSLDVDWHPDGARVRGLYGPKPTIWSLFIAAYAVCAFLAVFALAYGGAQWTLGRTPWALTALPAAAVGALVVYGLARYGQHRGRAQMDHLRHVLDAALSPPDPAP